MKNCHESEFLNKCLNKQVKIELKNGKIKCGVLKRPTNFEYVLQVPQGNFIFTKSLVKKIEEVK